MRRILGLCLALAFLLTGCGLPSAGRAGEPMAQIAKTNEPAAAPKPPAQPTPGQSAQAPEASGREGAYQPVIDAYIEAKASGFTKIDPILADTFPARSENLGSDMADLGVDIETVSLLYVLYDMNADRTPELFIIASQPDVNYIWSVYTIANNEAVSLLQQTGAREEILFGVNEDGLCAFSKSWTHMGITVELFYRLPAGGDSLTLEEGLYTDWNEAAQNDAYADLENHQIIQYGDHFKGVSDLYRPDSGKLTPITADEWFSISNDYIAYVVDFEEILELHEYPAGFKAYS